MSKETSALLRAVLIIAMTSSSVSEIIFKIRALCDKDELDAIAVEFEAMRKEKEGQGS